MEIKGERYVTLAKLFSHLLAFGLFKSGGDPSYSCKAVFPPVLFLKPSDADKGHSASHFLPQLTDGSLEWILGKPNIGVMGNNTCSATSQFPQTT